MDSVIIGISTFLVSGAAIVTGCHIALTLGRLRARRNPALHELEQIAAELRNHMVAPAPVESPRFELRIRSFRGFDSPPGRF
ncbi:MAG TPA: hypothetical protein VMT90_07830 [Dehalococcoidia bacterium]|jgi:hypothetical protein|nr:hypothetical protein [Dehalococcoidia bacterium]